MSLYYKEFGPGGRMAILQCENNYSACLLPADSENYQITVYQHGKEIYKEIHSREEVDGTKPWNEKEISIYLESAKIEANVKMMKNMQRKVYKDMTVSEIMESKNAQAAKIYATEHGYKKLEDKCFSFTNGCEEGILSDFVDFMNIEVEHIWIRNDAIETIKMISNFDIYQIALKDGNDYYTVPVYDYNGELYTEKEFAEITKFLVARIEIVYRENEKSYNKQLFFDVNDLFYYRNGPAGFSDFQKYNTPEFVEEKEAER